MCPALSDLAHSIPNDFSLSLSIDIDSEGKYTTRLGRFLSHSEESDSKTSRGLAKMEKCIEKSLLSAGFDRKFFSGRPFRLKYPFGHGVPCADSAGVME
jgi:hypothetical protein